MDESRSEVRIDEARISEVLETAKGHDAVQVRDILVKARELGGLGEEEIAVLAKVSDPGLIGEIFDAARFVKDTIYGNRLVLFAPLYVSNLCGNECVYCAFRARNKDVKRRVLTQEEIAAEVAHLVSEGHKRLLLVAGEAYPQEGFSYVLKSIATVYETAGEHGEIRRVNVNIAPLSVDEFRQLHDAKIGTYQLFQETYHKETYANVHLAGRKADFAWRLSTMDRAMAAGIDDVGIGVLFGLFDWRFEVLALMQHIRHLEGAFGVGPHTISVPRLEPATGSDIASHPPHAVSDIEFRKLVAILRLAVPYTGIIMSTREGADMRRETFALGVSQISAGSRTNPGGYSGEERYDESQFSLGDHRSLDEVVKDVAALGYMPSFCTACYRLGRTGADFMDLARPGLIKSHCQPNAVATFQEYLLDYASPETRAAGEMAIDKTILEMEPSLRSKTEKMVNQIRQGKRDIYC